MIHIGIMALSLKRKVHIVKLLFSAIFIHIIENKIPLEMNAIAID